MDRSENWKFYIEINQMERQERQIKSLFKDWKLYYFVKVFLRVALFFEKNCAMFSLETVSMETV